MRRVLAAFCMVMAATAALAHGDPDKPSHGGLVAIDKEITLELVATATQLTVYATDHGKKLSLADASGEATLLAGTDRRSAKLVAGGDALAAKGDFKVAAGTRVVLRVVRPGKDALQVRYTIK